MTIGIVPLRWLKITTIVVIFTVLRSTTHLANAQYCKGICPPLNDIGQPIESICVGDYTPPADSAKEYNPCSGTLPNSANKFSLDDFKGPGKVIVVSNYFFGCNAGRRESGVYAHVSQRLFDEYPNRIMFVASNQGASCSDWSKYMRDDAKSWYPNYPKPDSMPIVVDDPNYVIRDLYFTPPFAHPSYVVLDGDLKVRHKFTGPCCGKENFGDCILEEAKTLNTDLTAIVEDLLKEQQSTISPTQSPTPEEKNLTPSPAPTEVKDKCVVGEWSKWSACSVTCGSARTGMKFKWRVVVDNREPIDEDDEDAEPLPPCPTFVKTKPCTPAKNTCDYDVCTLEIGKTHVIKTIVNDLSKPRDVAFHPTPGLHLSTYSEGRPFPEGNLGAGEAWVLNGGNHSVSIVSAVNSQQQTTISRRDRGYYHYMIEATAFSFNSVGDSGRNPDRDSFNYWAICNDNLNTYLNTKEPNYFMGPTLYDSRPGNRNTVNHLGVECSEYESCHFMHADMLHESPACIGLAHDPETETAYGNVYWAFDATGNGVNGQLVRFDFQQPHGPGSMDHSIAAVRRYPEVELTRGEGVGGHAGMVVHSTRREVFIANPGEGNVIVVGADTGHYARIAREEYPIYSNRLPSFDYSIWECVEKRVFVSGLDTPSGLALSNDEERLYVAERGTGKILVYEVSSATLLNVIETQYATIGGLAISPKSGAVFFVDEDTNTLNSIKRTTECTDSYETRTNAEFVADVETASATFDQLNPPQVFSLYHDGNCVVETVIPNITYFDQVHNDTGYAGNHTEGTKELANRTDCEYDSELNFDALLLGGYYCHLCLPEAQGAGCDKGGVCENVQWDGYTCDNHYHVDSDTLKVTTSGGDKVKGTITMDPQVTYRFTVNGTNTVYLSEWKSRRVNKRLEYPGMNKGGVREVTNGEMTFDPTLFPKKNRPYKIYLRGEGSNNAKKIKINYLCRDYNLKYKGDVNKNCKWLAKNSVRKEKLCRIFTKTSKKCPATCGLCKNNVQSMHGHRSQVEKDVQSIIDKQRSKVEKHVQGNIFDRDYMTSESDLFRP